MTKRKFKVPHTLVILFGMVVLAQVLTYVVPAGSFARETVVDAEHDSSYLGVLNLGRRSYLLS